MNETLSKDRRARNFATIIYPESAPADWLQDLKDYHIAAFVSPLHNLDKDKDGNPKKPHYHVMVMFDGKKSTEQVRALFELLGGVGCEVVGSMRGYARYLCHLDDQPEKPLYNMDEVTQIAGANYADAIGLAIDRRTAIAEMQEYCVAHNVTEFAALMDYAASERPDWHNVLCTSGTIVMSAYLASRRHGGRPTD